MQPSWSILATCPTCGSSFTALDDTREGISAAAARLADHLRIHHAVPDAEAVASALKWLRCGELELGAELRRRDGTEPVH